MKRYILFTAALFISIISYSQPKYSINIFGGYSVPMSSLKGNFPNTLTDNSIDFQNASSYLTKSGYNFGAGGKITMDSTGNVRLIFGMTFNQFSQKQDYTTSANTIKTIANKLGIFTISAGLEYNFKPKAKFNPYAGIELGANFFSGSIVYSGDTILTLDRKAETRFGIILNAGAEYKTGGPFSFMGGIKYAMSNLMGKSSGTITSGTSTGTTDTQSTGVILNGEIPLNDNDAKTQLTRSIISLQLYLGISYNFGSIHNN